MNFKRTVSLICALIFSVSIPLEVSATSVGAHSFPGLSEDVVSHVSKIDLFGGKITGEKTQFYFVLPNGWKDNISADRENNLSDPMILEQINFYCNAISELYKPQLLFSLYVMDKKLWVDSSAYKPVMRSKDYVFAVKYGTNGFVLNGDSNMYKSKLAAVSNVTLIKKCIQLPPGQQESYEWTVLVDGMPVPHPVELVDSIYYINLKDACSALGYRVEWLNSTRSVFVHSSNFNDVFKVDQVGRTDGRGIKMCVINDMTYVSTAYFFRILKKNVEIDQNKNIYIFST